jgi:hypothetical protein
MEALSTIVSLAGSVQRMTGVLVSLAAGFITIVT